MTSVGFVPLSDLGTGFYLGQFQGGLYPGGQNSPPPAHEAEGLARAMGIEPLDALGNSDSAGKYVLLSIGMSNTTQEFCSQSSSEPCDAWTFMGQALPDPQVNHATLDIANGALGGQTAVAWDNPSDANYDRVRDTVLAPKGLTENQVQILWIKEANAGPLIGLPQVNADAFALELNLGNLVRAAKIRYPNLKIAFLSSRIYAGYATTGLNPEPFAYETGFSVKWLIEAQINQMAGGGIDARGGNLDYATVAPWLGWGPYLWADGLIPRSDGLVWECVDLQSDGTHPAMTGEEKVGTLLLDFLSNSPFAQPWFLAKGLAGDCDDDSLVGLSDYSVFVPCMAGPVTPVPPACVCVDFDADADADMLDFQNFAAAMTTEPMDNDPATDEFERAQLGAEWLVLSSTPGIVNGSDLGTLGGGIGQVVWLGSTFDADHYCEGVLSSEWSPLSSLQLNARVNTQTGAAYGLRRTGGGTLELRYLDVGTSVLLAFANGIPVNPGDTLRIEASGTTVRALKNGAEVLTATHSSLISGGVGVSMLGESGTAAPFFETWRGGSLIP